MDTMLEIAKRVDDFMMERSPVHDTMRRLAQTLGDLGIPFAIAGAMAANAHGHRRTTAAVDVLVRREDLVRFKDRWIGARGGAGVATWSHSLRTEQPSPRSTSQVCSRLLGPIRVRRFRWLRPRSWRRFFRRCPERAAEPTASLRRRPWQIVPTPWCRVHPASIVFQSSSWPSAPTKRSYRSTRSNTLPQTTRGSTVATSSPTASASRITNASFSDVPLSHPIGGLRICVVGCPGAGSATALSTRTTGTFGCAPANESRKPFSPARKGRSGRSSSNLINAASSSRLGEYTGGRREHIPYGKESLFPVPRLPRYSRSGNRLSRYFSRKNLVFASIHAFFRKGFQEPHPSGV